MHNTVMVCFFISLFSQIHAVLMLPLNWEKGDHQRTEKFVRVANCMSVGWNQPVGMHSFSILGGVPPTPIPLTSDCL